MIDFIREFKFGRPQQIAALLLVAFIVLCLFLPFDSTSTALYSNGRTRFWWPSPLQDGFRLVWTISRPALEIGNWLQTRINPRFGTDPSENGFWVDNTLRMPFLIFGVSLAGAIWWVSRRLYDNAGGYVALSLFSFSWWTILWTSSAYAEIIAAWGLYGMIYTSIGVAHTLYASPQKWRPRIVLLGLAFGFTLCAHFLAFAVGLILCTAFMLYLAPRRRTISVVVLATACLIAMTMLLVLHGWHFGSTLSEFKVWSAHGIRLNAYPWQWTLLRPQNQDILLAEFFGLAFGTFLIWKRTRYFGNAVPLIVAVSLFFLQSGQRSSMPWIWSLPFLFTFIGGICSDLFESKKFGSAWKLSIAIILLAYAILGVLALRPAMS